MKDSERVLLVNGTGRLRFIALIVLAVSICSLGSNKADAYPGNANCTTLLAAAYGSFSEYGTVVRKIRGLPLDDVTNTLSEPQARHYRYGTGRSGTCHDVVEKNGTALVKTWQNAEQYVAEWYAKFGYGGRIKRRYTGKQLNATTTRIPDVVVNIFGQETLTAEVKHGKQNRADKRLLFEATRDVRAVRLAMVKNISYYPNSANWHFVPRPGAPSQPHPAMFRFLMDRGVDVYIHHFPKNQSERNTLKRQTSKTRMLVLDMESPHPQRFGMISRQAFLDVRPASKYHSAVDWAADYKITKGINPLSFDPRGNVTRGQFATFLWRLYGSPTVPPAARHQFADVSPGIYYERPIQWMLMKGITNGCGGNSFCPDQELQRKHIATFLWRAAGKPRAPGGYARDGSSYYYTAANWVKWKQVMNTVGPYLRPENPHTRAETVRDLRNFASLTTLPFRSGRPLELDLTRQIDFDCLLW